MAASQLSCHRSHCDHHSTRESRHNCLLSQITAHRNCVSIHNFSQRGITTRIATPIMSRNVPNSCANLKSRIVPQSHFLPIGHTLVRHIKLPPVHPLAGDREPQKVRHILLPPFHLRSPLVLPNFLPLFPARLEEKGVNIKFNRLHSKLHTSLNSSSAPGVSACAGVVKSSS